MEGAGLRESEEKGDLGDLQAVVTLAAQGHLPAEFLEEERMSARSADDRIWFEQGVDGLFNIALQRNRTPSLIGELRKVGIDLERKLDPGYPAAVWEQAVKVAAREIFPGEGEALATYRIGECFVDGYQNTGMGKALYLLLRTLGARRTLPKLGRNMRHVNNYMQATVTEPIDGCFRVTLNGVGTIPHFYKALLDASWRLLGAARPSAKTFDLVGGDLTLYVDLNEAPHPKFSQLWSR